MSTRDIEPDPVGADVEPCGIAAELSDLIKQFAKAVEDIDPDTTGTKTGASLLVEMSYEFTTDRDVQTFRSGVQSLVRRCLDQAEQAGITYQMFPKLFDVGNQILDRLHWSRQ